MALVCAMSLNTGVYSAGQTPPPQATLTVYNPNAVAVSVTGVQVTARAFGDTPINHVPMAPVLPAIGPGMTTSVPPLGTITVGPFPIVVGSAANANSFQVVNQTANLNPINPQGPALVPQTIVMVGAAVNGSDGSVNVASEAGLTVSYSNSPPLGYQGGFLNYAGPNNFVTGLCFGVL